MQIKDYQVNQLLYLYLSHIPVQNHPRLNLTINKCIKNKTIQILFNLYHPKLVITVFKLHLTMQLNCFVLFILDPYCNTPKP